MKKHLWIVWAVMLFMGCAAPMEKKGELPGAEPPYQPQRIYPASFDRAWEATLQALQEDQVPVQTVEREEGLIRTDFQPAPKGARYKFHIKLSRHPAQKTAILVRCTYEGKDEKGEYRDFTYASPRQVMTMEDGLYRRIESALLAGEKKTSERPVTPAPPPLTAAPPASPAPAEVSPSRPPVPPSPPSGPPETPKASTAEPKRTVIILVTQKTGLLMAEPSSESAVLMVLKKDLEIEKLGETGAWVNVGLESGKTGWVARNVFDMPGAPALAPKERETPAPKKEEASASPPPPPAVASPSKTGPSASPAASAQKTRRFLAAQANVHMREAPSSQSRIVTTLAKGKQVEKLGETPPFTRVRVPGGKTGWVASQYLREVSAPPPPVKPEPAKTKSSKKEGVFLVTLEKAPLKANPAQESQTITVLKKGREVQQIGKSGSWTKVKLSWGTEGWVADSLLQKLRE